MFSLRLLAVVVLLATVAACGGGGGNNNSGVPVVGDDCPYIAGTACGVTKTGVEAVLVCAMGNIWTAEELCAETCVSAGQGPQCFGGGADVPEDSGPDITTDMVDDVAQDDAIEDTQPDEAESPDVLPDESSTDIEVVYDFEPPTVLSTSPANDEMNVSTQGLVIRVEFSEPMFKTLVNTQTVHVTDADLNPVVVSIDWEDAEGRILLMTAMSPIFPAAPYIVELGSILSDLSGNKLNKTYRFMFFTASQYDMGKYQAIAGKYAPTLYVETNTQSPQFDYPTKFDLDNNYNASDNVDAIQAATVIEPVVYYSVTETKSHFFIFYGFYFPYRWTEAESSRFGNDISGSLVVVRKSDQMPIAVETYFNAGNQDERSFSFVTQDSGLIPDGYTYLQFKFDGTYPREALFPSNRYEGYISARRHESCLWLDENNSYLDGCVLNAGYKYSMKKITYSWKNGQTTPISKTGGSFPQQNLDVGYALTHVLDTWWSRRTDIGEDRVFSALYSYVPYTNPGVWPVRPKLSSDVASFFIDPLENDHGRPPWAWKYNPKNGTSFFEIERGVFFLDPAVHFRVRHDAPFIWEQWDGSDGWSTDYCFNPYFGIDNRTLWPSECSAP